MATIRTTHLQHGASPVPNITLAADGTVSFSGSAGFVTVTHGTVASTARPDTPAVYWVGPVPPENAAAGDLWFGTMPVVASGGTVTDITVNGIAYRVHTFTTSGDFVVSRGGDVEYLVVGGGGGGGVRSGGGGGGAGGLLEGSMTVDAGTHAVEVGAGGFGNTTTISAVTSGGQSSFRSVVAFGGGSRRLCSRHRCAAAGRQRRQRRRSPRLHGGNAGRVGHRRAGLRGR